MTAAWSSLGKTEVAVAGAAAAAVTVATVAGAAIWNKIAERRWVRVGTVDKLYVFPIKGAKAIEVTSASFERLGPRAAVFRDRTFCVIKHDDRYVSSSDYPRLMLVEMLYSEGRLLLRAPGMADLPIDAHDLDHTPDKEIVIRMIDVNIRNVRLGDKYDQFISQFLLGEPNGLRLVYHFSESPQRPVRPKYPTLWPDSIRPTDAPALQYMTSYTLLTWGSLKGLNSRLQSESSNGGAIEVTPEWLRPNIMVKTDKGLDCEEDEWTGRVRLGRNGAVLRFQKPCHRCLQITVDPFTGERNQQQEPLKTLRSYRLLDGSKSELDAARRKYVTDSPLFCVNYALDSAGVVNIGDDVYVERK